MRKKKNLKQQSLENCIGKEIPGEQPQKKRFQQNKHFYWILVKSRLNSNSWRDDAKKEFLNNKDKHHWENAKLNY